MKFFENILNSENPTSSKRFGALVGMLLFSTVVICALCGVDVKPELYYVTSGFSLTCLGLSVLQK